MFCSKCGAQNEAGAAFCAKCGAQLSPSAGGPAAPAAPNPSGIAIAQIPTYMVQAVLVTLFCCLPLGIVAIVKASGVSKWQGLGNFELALKASGEAKTWCWISFGLGLAVIVGYIALVFMAGLGALVSASHAGG